MSLISDTRFLIHNLRLSYLRDVEDPYGARIISLDPSYASNPYIHAANLTDEERWPELTLPDSPQLSEDEGERPSGFPGAKLKYTQTIMGGRTGGLGLRTNAKRQSMSKRASAMSGTPRSQEDVQNFVQHKALLQDSHADSTPVGAKASETLIQVVPPESASSTPNPLTETRPLAEEPPPEVPRVVQFIPKFKGAAEMEERRRQRMARWRGNDKGGAAVQPEAINDSSSEDDDLLDSSDSDFPTQDADDLTDDGFDESFSESRPTGVSSDSEFGNDLVSRAGNEVHSYAQQPNLSPVSEDDMNTPDDFFEMVTPAVTDNQRRGEKYVPPRRLSTAVPTKAARSSIQRYSFAAPSSDQLFTKRKVDRHSTVPAAPSALSQALASTGSSSNPFSETYAAISGRGESASMNVLVFFPHAQSPRGQPLELNVRKDSSIEEVLGFALWSYWEEDWLPKLNDHAENENDPKLSAVGWILRLAEDDGEVDDDFPAPDRSMQASKFSADAYAALEATPAQITQNQLLQSKIQRRPSRTTGSTSTTKLVEPKAAAATTTLSLPVPGLVSSSMVGSVPLSTSIGPSSSHGPQLFLRIRIAESADDIHVSTTIPVSAGTYMQEALEMVCAKRKLDPKEYSLLVSDVRMVIPLDRTVASLQGKRELMLMKRSIIENSEERVVKVEGRTTDPNASIFKRISDTPPEAKLSAALDYTTAYKKFTIYRKLPVLVARQERMLAIDGVHIYILPSNKARAVFDSGKTSSYHIKSVIECTQSNKSSASFKLILNRGGSKKRFDYEAETPKLAGEIVQTVKTLKAAVERSGTLRNSRRSRTVGA